MFESEFEGRLVAALHAFELDAARFHPPSVDEVIALGESAPMTAELMAQLEAIDPTTLEPDQRVGWTVGCQRAANHWEALRASGVVATTQACPDDPQAPRELHAAGQLGPALGLGTGATDALIAESTQLVEVLPDAHATAIAGNLSWRKASSLASHTLGMAPDAARRVAGKVLAKSWHRSPARHDAAVRRAVDQVDPEHADRTRKDREHAIRLAKHHYGAGMGQLFADMPSEELDLVWTAADAFARRMKTHGDPRSLDHLRVAFLSHAARSYLTHGDPAHCDNECDPLPPDPTPAPAGVAADQPAAEAPPPTPPTRHGRPVALPVVWDLTSLLGLTNHCALLRDSATMLPPSAMRGLLAGGARVRRMIINPDTGEQLDLTPKTWLLPATDGRLHRQPVVLTITTTARWDDLPENIRAAVDAADPDLTAILRELLDYPLTADDLDGSPDAEQPSPALSEFTASRAGHPVNPCAGPTAASAGDIDHHQARSNGGKTVRSNLGPLVRRWHRLKTFTDWTVKQVQHRWQWTSPTGRKYTIEPHDYRLGP
jgi:hypothetical protein